MREIGITEAGATLGVLVDQVIKGEDIILTRGGQPVVRLVPTAPAFDRIAARRAAGGLIEASKGVTLGGIAIKDLINEGRP